MARPTKYKPHIRPFHVDGIAWYCEFMRKEDNIVQSGFGDTPEQAYKACLKNKNSITRGNALLDIIEGKYGASY